MDFAIAAEFLKSRLGQGLALVLLLLAAMASCTHEKDRAAQLRMENVRLHDLLYVPDESGRPTSELWQDRAIANGANLRTCILNATDLRGSYEAQKSALEALKVDADRRVASVAQGAQAAKKQAVAAISAADRVLATKDSGSDTCKRVLDAERAVTEATQ